MNSLGIYTMDEYLDNHQGDIHVVNVGVNNSGKSVMFSGIWYAFQKSGYAIFPDKNDERSSYFYHKNVENLKDGRLPDANAAIEEKKAPPYTCVSTRKGDEKTRFVFWEIPGEAFERLGSGGSYAESVKRYKKTSGSKEDNTFWNYDTNHKLRPFSFDNKFLEKIIKYPHHIIFIFTISFQNANREDAVMNDLIAHITEIQEGEEGLNAVLGMAFVVSMWDKNEQKQSKKYSGPVSFFETKAENVFNQYMLNVRRFNNDAIFFTPFSIGELDAVDNRKLKKLNLDYSIELQKWIMKIVREHKVLEFYEEEN